MIRLDVAPIAKPRMTRRDRWDQRPAVARYWQFKDDLNKAALKQGFALGQAFRVVFLMPMPASWSQRKRRRMAGQPHQVRPDCDNLMKAIKDCLLDEDSHVWLEEGSKVWAEAGAILVENIEDDEQERRLGWINETRCNGTGAVE